MKKNFRLAFVITLLAVSAGIKAQVNAVTFGKNRVQYKKLKWEYIQTENFNVYYTQGGKELAKFIVQCAEAELPSVEKAASYALQRRANIICYNQFDDLKQSNIGLENDWISTGSTTKLVNNKMVVYFDADHNKLKYQIREGIAKVLTDNILFGDDLGEFATNQALLDLPKWMTDGYIAYIGQNWSTTLDDELKVELMSGTYKNFYHLAHEKPLLAGHAFWYYIEERYKKENVTYLLNLARIYKNMNKACQRVCKKKLKAVLADFMEYETAKYDKDLEKRRAYPKGSLVESFETGKRLDYYRFAVNPVKKNNTYAMVEFFKGIVRVRFYDDDKFITLLKYGIRTYDNQRNPNYPLIAWDPKGTRIAVMYIQEGRLKLFVYDALTRVKQYKLDITDKFDLVQEFKYMLDSKTLLLSAVKNGHTDIFTFDIEKETVRQITNDVYDDLDATQVSFPNKTGIIFSSNRPNAYIRGGDTSLPSNNQYNIFLVSDFGDKPELNQMSQLTQSKFGNARYPMPYNENHFTYVSDENGIGNRYAGFFTTKKEGLDTLIIIGDEILRNPTVKEVDSALTALNKTDIDSMAVVSISKDSAYTFPLTNYETTLEETQSSGDTRQVSEVTQEGYEKNLYKLKINEEVLRKRNVNAQPTEYMRRLLTLDKIAQGEFQKQQEAAATDTAKKEDDLFQTEFAGEKKDTSMLGKVVPGDAAADKVDVLAKAKYFKYKPPKFSVDNGNAGFNNNILVNRYQPYGGPDQTEPIRLGSSTPLSGLIRIGTTELMEDIKITGAYRLSTNLKDNEWFMNYQNYKRRLDWGGSFYRNVNGGSVNLYDTAGNLLGFADGKNFTNLYQFNISWPFDETKSIRLTQALRSDKLVIDADIQKPQTLLFGFDRTLFSLTHLEFVYDNSLNPAMNIWNGLRYKVYFDWNRQANKVKFADGPNTMNLGFDVRYYYPIFRNFIWAGRAGGDFSWGDQKLIYYLGGVDSWLFFGQNVKQGTTKERYFISGNKPANDIDYAYQSLAVNLRGFRQNVANGNNAVVLNSEFRLPVFSTLLKKPINNAFIRNFMITQFVDLGTAWNGNYNSIQRPSSIFGTPPVTIKTKVGGVGPFAGGYGFGARSTLLGYYIKYDCAWTMDGIFKGKPMMYFSLGLDF